MKMIHFSHEHPLILKDVVPEANDEREIICYGCQKLISNVESAYVCGQCSEGYFLHKVCAELPKEIMHPNHDQHSLILLPRNPYVGYNRFFCSECKEDISGFTYHCSICEFDLDVSCALKNNYTLLSTFKEREYKHEGHQHPIVFQPSPALIRCDACGVEDKDLLFICPSCPFVIHNSCALLNSINNSEHHDHPLSLAYSFPSHYENWVSKCDICHKKLFNHHWVCYCRLCRYFVHLKCMKTKPKQIEVNLDDDWLDDTHFEEQILKVLLEDNLFHIPTPNMTVKLIERFLLRKNSLAQIQPEINHWSHTQHPLVLFNNEQQNKKDADEEDKEVICNCCIEPIYSNPYYCCVECNYFLHLPCAKLPNTIQHPTHPHKLRLCHYKNVYDSFRCNKCNQYSNGFFFECETCNFFLDVKCVAFPTIIEHENHNHPLFQFEASGNNCNACDYKFSGLAFGCELCGFYLHYKCAKLPWAIRHRFDEHHVPLRFPPYSDHPDDFICDICEEEMHPKFWLYHCSECDNSFHTICVPSIGRFPNYKFGDIFEVSSHSHPLEFKRNATLKSSCDGCGKNIDDCGPFECEDCNFCLCHSCMKEKLVNL